MHGGQISVKLHTALTNTAATDGHHTCDLLNIRLCTCRVQALGT